MLAHALTGARGSRTCGAKSDTPRGVRGKYDAALKLTAFIEAAGLTEPREREQMTQKLLPGLMASSQSVGFSWFRGVHFLGTRLDGYSRPF